MRFSLLKMVWIVVEDKIVSMVILKQNNRHVEKDLLIDLIYPISSNTGVLVLISEKVLIFHYRKINF